MHLAASYDALVPLPVFQALNGGGVKVACISSHRGVQLILACSWARPAILVAGKGIGGMFLFLPCPSFSSLLLSLLPFSGRQHKMTHKG